MMYLIQIHIQNTQIIFVKLTKKKQANLLIEFNELQFFIKRNKFENGQLGSLTNTIF